VTYSRHVLLLLPLLVALGQQAGLLHQLGHDLDAAARVVAPAGAATGADIGAGDPGPDAEGHAGACALCVGYGGAAGSAPAVDSAKAPESSAFGRPLPGAAARHAVFAAGTPIRGPPPALSVPA